MGKDDGLELAMGPWKQCRAPTRQLKTAARCPAQPSLLEVCGDPSDVDAVWIRGFIADGNVGEGGVEVPVCICSPPDPHWHRDLALVVNRHLVTSKAHLWTIIRWVVLKAEGIKVDGWHVPCLAVVSVRKRHQPHTPQRQPGDDHRGPARQRVDPIIFGRGDRGEETKSAMFICLLDEGPLD